MNEHERILRFIDPGLEKLYEKGIKTQPGSTCNI